ncbi:MAG: AsmA family protein [Omnitrophica bacterium]|nr:AsmA family protein [Candidatus Omnitrophota bacterium]
MFKKSLKICLVLILLIVLTLAFFRHSLCRFLIYSAASKATGLELSIEDLHLDILNSSLYLRGVTLFNPPGFKNKTLAKAKEISIEYDLLGSLKRGFHLRQVKVDIGEVNIIRDEKGTSNLSSFKKKKASLEPSKKDSATSSTQRKVKRSKEEVRPKFLIDRLEISLEKATFIDYGAGIGEPAVIVFTMKGPYVFKDVSNLGYLVKSTSAKGGFKYLLNNLAELIPKDTPNYRAE